MNGLDLQTGRTVGRFFWVTGLASWEISESGLARWEICHHWVDSFDFFYGGGGRHLMRRCLDLRPTPQFPSD